MRGNELNNAPPITPTSTRAKSLAGQPRPGSPPKHYRCKRSIKQLKQPKAALNELVHHSDHGSQYVSITYHERLRQAGIEESTTSVGDSYHNALAESVNGLYKAELINQRTWDGLTDVEWETMCWVHWWNTTHIHSELDYHTP